MTIRTMLMILAFAVGSGTSETMETNSTTWCPPERVCKIGNNCWKNGIWYNPCPAEFSDPSPEPSPETQPPS